MESKHDDEDELRKTNRLLLEAEVLGNVGSWEHDVRTGAVRSTEGNRRLFFGGDTSRGARLEDYQSVMHPGDREWVLRRWHQESQGGTWSHEIEFRVVWPDGSVHVIHGLSQVVRDETGKALRLFGTNADVTERRRAEEEVERRVKQQAAVAKLGQSALQGGGLQALFEEAVDLVARTSEVEICEVAELLPGDLLQLRAAQGWEEGLVGPVRLPTGSGSRWAFMLASGEPSVVADLRRETRFAAEPLLLEQGFVSVVTVIIKGGGQPFGTLGAAVRAARTFTGHDINFLQSMANVLAAAIERARVAGQLGEKREQLQSLSRKLIAAQEAERRSIARELHDDFGQMLTTLRLHLQRTGPAAQSSAEGIALIDEAIGRLRDLALDLRPAMLDDLGLAAALRWYVGRETARAGLGADVDVSFEERLSVAVETTCFRLVQEALNNVVRHAAARRVQVSLRSRDGLVELLLHDDGRGFDVAAARREATSGASQGLLTMQERASLAGGTLTIDSGAGQGTTVRALFAMQPRVGP